MILTEQPAMQIALIANGEIQDYSNIQKKLKRFDQVFAVDGGLHHCHAMHITPSLILGDFDSCSQELLNHYPHIKQKSYPVDKDLSDLALAVNIAQEFLPTMVSLFAATGRTRQDHLLANIFLLSAHPNLLCIENEDEQIRILSNPATLFLTPGQTLSLIPLHGPVIGVTTQGLKWDLCNHTLNKTFFSLSNKAVSSSIRIEFQPSQGDLLCVIQGT